MVQAIPVVLCRHCIDAIYLYTFKFLLFFELVFNEYSVRHDTSWGNAKSTLVLLCPKVDVRLTYYCPLISRLPTPCIFKNNELGNGFWLENRLLAANSWT